MRGYQAALKKVFLGFLILSVVFVFCACGSNSDVSDTAVSEDDTKLVIESSSDSDAIIVGSEEETQNFGGDVMDSDDSSSQISSDESTFALSDVSKEIRQCKTEEECIEALRVFANPNGNGYDALTVLGEFRYSDMDYDDILELLENASVSWHDEVEGKVGGECRVSIDIAEKSYVAMDDLRVTDCAVANNITPEAYTNIKCNISTDYLNDSYAVDINLVKVNDLWYLAEASAIDDLKNILTTKDYK